MRHIRWNGKPNIDLFKDQTLQILEQQWILK